MDSTRKDGLVFGFLTQSQANFYASINGWKSEITKSSSMEKTSSSMSLSNFDGTNDSALSEPKSINDMDMQNKFPISLAGGFELAVMVLVRELLCSIKSSS